MVLLLLLNFIVASLPLVLGLVVTRYGGARRDNDVDWYEELDKPDYVPPPIVFSIVWPILYALMGASVFVATWTREPQTIACVYLALLVNMGFNLAFPFLQFRERDLRLAMLATWGALISAVAMLLVYYLTTAGWIGVVASGLWTPYTLWLVLATAMSTDIYRMNVV